MKILTWNINGIRSSQFNLKNKLEFLNADIVCFQETKITRDQLDDSTAVVEGYTSYFSFSKKRTGYSGVATFVKNNFTPIKAEEGLSGLLSKHAASEIACHGNQSDFDNDELRSLDSEGRSVLTQHTIRTENGEELLTIINVYCPRADPEREDRKLYKLRFYQLLEIRARALLKNSSHVIILGDVNTSHKRLDSCDPAPDFDKIHSRKWLNEMLWRAEDDDADHATGAHKFVDSFRYYHPKQEKAYTCWNTMTGARATNYGTRIDYILGNVDLVKQCFTDCVILPDVQGSDHCPVMATLHCDVIPAAKCPQLCTKYLPEFAGTQQTLSFFITKTSKSLLNSSMETSNGPSAEHKVVFTTADSRTASSNSNLKRSLTTTNSIPCKKLKLKEKQSSGSKQATLLGFVNKIKSVSKQNSLQADDQTPSLLLVKDGHSIEANSSSIDTEKTDNAATIHAWKTLLKGPAAVTAPSCKGHSEACVLRTVKKSDSLNKGRQFWVCQRPDGEKGNQLARCDHFEWVPKKPKSK